MMNPWDELEERTDLEKVSEVGQFVLIDYIHEIETELIIRALHSCNKNKAQAARMLGLNRTTLVEKCKRLGIVDKYVSSDN